MNLDRRDRRARRGTALVVTLTIALVQPASSAPADSAKARKTFRAETKGVSHPTLYGRWNDDDASTSNEARLIFGGGHAVGEYTRFIGTWISPRSTSSKVPTLTVDYEVGFSNELGQDVELVQSIRARYPGGGWGRWVRKVLSLPSSQSDVVFDGFNVVVPLGEPDRLIFQWKVAGKLPTPASVQGDFRLSVS